ncbi:MAG TPA: response regulator [Flavipsychrobacter sp.]|nr:response regulator [Flavipsychrobacter sp.]
MYKALLIDDESLARQLIKSLLKSYEHIEIVAECTDGFEGFKMIQQLRPDLIFLDVQMPRVNGFEMLELLDDKPQVIFTTAFDEYALKAFEANAVDYLLKPITRERFDQALQKWLKIAGMKPTATVDSLLEENVYEGYRHRIVVKDNGLIRIIPEQEIHFIEASDDYIKIFTKEGKFLKKATMSFMERSLDPKHFVRVHRSFLIPINQLQRIEPYEKDGHIALLHCGARVAVSKTGFTKLKSMLNW